jgi:hypothetical protein
MDRLIELHPAICFPLFFATLWLAVTTVLALVSGWFRLMTTFPDQLSEPSLRLRGQSGTMGSGVAMHGILTLSICQAGLRIGMVRLFGPFCRDFLVPWDVTSVSRKSFLFWPMARLEFGHPIVGTLRVSAHVANRLARAAGHSWPETGSFPAEAHGATFRRLLLQWAAITGVAALFFTIVPSVVAPNGAGPPVALAILFPAIVFGMGFLWRFFREKS